MTRLATRGCRVLYFECRSTDATPHTDNEPTPHGGVVQIKIDFVPGRRLSLKKWTAAQKIARTLREHKIVRPLLWFTHPSLFALGYSHPDCGIVYDSGEILYTGAQMDDDLYFEELMMLAEADLVFANGDVIENHLLKMIDVLKADSRMLGNRHPGASLPVPLRIDTSHNASNEIWEEASCRVLNSITQVLAKNPPAEWRQIER